jgi:hypothetical protein
MCSSLCNAEDKMGMLQMKEEEAIYPVVSGLSRP